MQTGSVVFDRYRLEERIGAGGMGVVWRANDLLLQQPVALKRVWLAEVDDQHTELTRERALREARLAARLRHHQHVVAIYDVRADDGDVWLVLEYLPSQSLARILRERGPLDPAQAARIGAQVADALAAAQRWASSTATSLPATCSSPTTAPPNSPTSASHIWPATHTSPKPECSGVSPPTSPPRSPEPGDPAQPPTYSR